MTTNSKLLSLPNELLLHVLANLDNADIAKVRIVCRHLNSISIDEFGQRCCRHLLVMHHERSVTNLQTLASHPRLKCYVQNITVTGTLSKEDMRNQLELCANWHQDLASTIQRFPTLKTFTIDNLSSAIASILLENSICGEETCSCIFRVATKVFQSPCQSNKLKLNLWISANDAQPYVHLFDPKATSWTDKSASKVSSLRLVTSEEGDNTWEVDLLHSVQNLQHFNLEGSIPDPTWEVLSWPTLNTMELKDLHLPNSGFVAFIMKHNTTLSSVSLVDVTVLEGTWLAPLLKITELKEGVRKICHVHLINLYQTNSSAEVPALELNFLEMEPELVLNDSDDIDVAAEAFRLHFCTTSPNVLSDSMYMVDFRHAKAAVEGQIQYENGHWKL